MSYGCWTTEGYGIYIGDLEIRSDTSLYDLVCMNESVYNRISKRSGCKTKEEMTAFLNDRDRRLLCIDEGIAQIMSNIIEKNEHFYMTPIVNYLGDEYLIYEPSYPWSAKSKEEEHLTPAVLDEIIRKYVKVISDTDVTPQYYSIEDCG